MTGPVITRPPGTIPYADSERFKGCFGVESDSQPGVIYIVSWDSAGGYWVCSCKAGIHRGWCKHLTRYRKSPTRADAMRAVAEALEASKQAAAADKALREAEKRRAQITAAKPPFTLGQAGEDMEAGDPLVRGPDGRLYRVSRFGGDVVGLAQGDAVAGAFVGIVPAGPTVGRAMPDITWRERAPATVPRPQPERARQAPIDAPATIPQPRFEPSPAGARPAPAMPAALAAPPVRRFRAPGEV